jgi:hypothetical protein
VPGAAPADFHERTRLLRYPANLCPLLFYGELAEFGGDFGEAI